MKHLQCGLKIFIFIISTSCATNHKEPTFRTASVDADKQEFIVALDSVNNKIWGDYGKKFESYEEFTLDNHNHFLRSYKSKRAKQLQKDLKAFEYQSMNSYKTSFVFCGFSTKWKYAFCDDAACAGVEHHSQSDDPNTIEAWKAKLPLNSCKTD